MRSFSKYLYIILVVLLATISQQAQATHIRAGEITARRISATSLTYEIRLTAYFDMQNGEGAANAQNTVQFYIGSEGPIIAPRVNIVNIGNNTTQNTYIINHTFPAAGKFRISFEEDNRNNNVLNIGPPPTQNLNFYVSTTLEINANFGMNQTPVMLNAPIDLAAVGQRYIHNPGAFDADGDSLAYRLFVPQRGTSNGGGINLQYEDPNMVVVPAGSPSFTETGASPATFSMDPITGDMVWDAPMVEGYYNVAFIVEEWRDGVLIGQIVRDMQIIVEDANNDRPALDPLAPICVEAGTRINQLISATDKNGDRLTLSSSGGVYDASLVSPELASFLVPNQGTQGTISGNFVWQTSCAHIRQEPYDVLFKVEDGPAAGAPNPALFRRLTDYKSLNIQVYGPKPKNLTGVDLADPAGLAYQLTWDAYQCQTVGAKIVIYRKEGCTTLPEDVCVSGIPAGYGYTEIGRVGIGQTTFLDNNNGAGLRTGVSYSYRLVAVFPRPGANPSEPGSLIGGGESIASDEFCLNLPMVMPVITNVTVDVTDKAAGEITVRWTRPTASSGLPAQYQLYRAEGQNGTNYSLIATINTNLEAGALDTLFVDKGLNTTDNAYRYRLDYYFTENGLLTKLDASEAASSVWLQQGSAIPTNIRLNWSAIVPWSNNNQVHRVYREDKANPGTFNRIAEVSVTGAQSFTYIDDGTDRYTADGSVDVAISTNDQYCYKVETVGSYNNSQIKPDKLYNFSQIICVTASDTTKPCAPVLSIDLLDCSNLSPDTYCNTTSFANNLSWEYPQQVDGKDCDQNIAAYKIYYARYETDSPSLLTTVTTPPAPLATTYTHNGLKSYAGCYYVTALNGFGTESAPSNIVCKDNCPAFVLPNVFTPNGDGKNDVFQPMECPAFVQSLEFRVFNRWGAQVFDTKDVNVNWNGTTNAGKELSAGQYYYEAKVFFESSKVGGTATTIKGWVQLLR
ncbi:gliding motility-associated-like protein [Dyadobacter jejuensis]|uniref:Gliding motility-associated-like protein n=1 Tax=Dyadobacter jejuensis TaxID=1082580 RepID=A0A316ARQ0_9BACT|nr:gliding motility-associated C-terminal domain-containing protein [Dyadobacter jejuensis]PWJ59914.1 gliding motility-associated-like protein [Dyadobacter jejuensis]